MNPINSYDLEVVRKLKVIKSVPRRDAQRALAGRAAFLQEARELAQAVSAAPEMSPIGWKQKLLILFSTRKERSPMLSTLTTLIVAFTLIIGGGGLTLASAQNSMPDQPLYNLKMWSEALRLNLAADPQAAWQLAQSFAERRAAETRAMLAAGQSPSEAIQARYQSQVELAIRLAGGLPDDQALPALEQTRKMLRNQELVLSQLQLQNDAQSQAVRERIRLMLQERLNWVNAGIERQQHRNGSPAKSPTSTGQPTATVEPPAKLTPAGAAPTSASPNEAGNAWTSGTPTPGSGYGPGPGDGTCDACTPAGSSNPWTTGTSTPGSSYGPGPNPTQSGMGDNAKPQQPRLTQPPAETQFPPTNPTQSQPQSTPKGPRPQKTPGGGKNGG
jgi:Domain of unknown function (DUF5667)